MKSQLRQNAKQIRAGLDMAAISRDLCAELRKQTYYKRAKHVMIFYPRPGEVDVRELLNDREKSFYLPRVDDKSLKCCPFGDLRRSPLGIMEPCTDATDTDKLDLIIVPALMADYKGNRLGYGGGFYDRFLAANPFVPSVMLLPAALVTDELPTEPHDVQIKHLIYAPA
jgi:5-formyltetrahydrofolate cyclo-ligase